MGKQLFTLLVLGIFFFTGFNLDARNFRFGMTLEERNHRLMIVSIDRKSKSFEAGLRRGDFLLGINGKRISSMEDLKRILDRIGNRSLFYISRSGYKKEILIQFQEDFIYDAGNGNYNIGLSIEEIADGLYVREVEKASPAYEGGIDQGDIIVGANGYRISKVQHLKRVLDYHTEGELVLYVKRENQRYKARVTMNPDFQSRSGKSGGNIQKPESSQERKAPPPRKDPVGKTGGRSSDERAPAAKPEGGQSDYDRLLEKFATDS